MITEEEYRQKTKYIKPVKTVRSSFVLAPLKKIHTIYSLAVSPASFFGTHLCDRVVFAEDNTSIVYDHKKFILKSDNTDRLKTD